LTDGDPFDVSTGIYQREYHDLYVHDTIPIDLVRTQRNMDPRSRAFGTGASTSYDMFIVGDAQRFSWVALVLPNGSQVRYTRISSGTGFVDAVFEDKADPSHFFGSHIWWNNQGSWTVKLREGTEYTVQGCSPTSKRPGQCAVTEIKNAQGERLTIQRDRDGNILRVTSPHGRFVTFTNDSLGRITGVEDDSKHWVRYEYDPAGWLAKALNGRGDIQQFKYDKRFNMTYVRERGPGRPNFSAYDFSVTNYYDKKNRFNWQHFDSGKNRVVYKARYYDDAQGKVRRVDVTSPDGLTYYWFNPAGYAVQERYVPLKGGKWRLDYRRSSDTNAVLGMSLRCATGRLPLPPETDLRLAELGDSHERYLSEICVRYGKNPKAALLPEPGDDED